jgi:tetratricopeptide (TPR) repeat protein
MGFFKDILIKKELKNGNYDYVASMMEEEGKYREAVEYYRLDMQKGGDSHCNIIQCLEKLEEYEGAMDEIYKRRKYWDSYSIFKKYKEYQNKKSEFKWDQVKIKEVYNDIVKGHGRSEKEAESVIKFLEDNGCFDEVVEAIAGNCSIDIKRIVGNFFHKNGDMDRYVKFCLEFEYPWDAVKICRKCNHPEGELEAVVKYYKLEKPGNTAADWIDAIRKPLLRSLVERLKNDFVKEDWWLISTIKLAYHNWGNFDVHTGSEHAIIPNDDLRRSLEIGDFSWDKLGEAMKYMHTEDSLEWDLRKLWGECEMHQGNYERAGFQFLLLCEHELIDDCLKESIKESPNSHATAKLWYYKALACEKMTEREENMAGENLWLKALDAYNKSIEIDKEIEPQKKKFLDRLKERALERGSLNQNDTDFNNMCETLRAGGEMKTLAQIYEKVGLNDRAEAIRKEWKNGQGVKESEPEEKKDKGLSCSNCGREVEEGWNVCPYCKEDIEKERICCGIILEEDWKACPKCGKVINA